MCIELNTRIMMLDYEHINRKKYNCNTLLQITSFRVKQKQEHTYII
jgi:hypothetical protein